MQQNHQQAADGQVRQIAEQARPAECRTQAHRYDQDQKNQREKTGVGVPKPLKKSTHKKDLPAIKPS